MDRELYPNPAFQPNESLNLISDTAYYFITYDNTTHQRVQEFNNTIPNPAPASAPYCWVVAKPGSNPRGFFNGGQSHNMAVKDGFFLSSDFDLGEGYSYTGLGYRQEVYISTPEVYNSGPNATLSFAVVGHSLSVLQHFVSIAVNSNTVFNGSSSNFDILRNNAPVPLTQLSANNSIVIRDRDSGNFYLPDLSIRYPRTYDFSGNFSQTASFEILAGQQYLVVENFNTGGPPRLYDPANGKVYNNAAIEGGRVRFYLDNSTSSRKLFLSSVSAITNLSNFKRVQFRDYSSGQNQGDFILLTHKDYIQASPAYVNDYRSYRSSSAGGGYTPVVVDVTELYDQFGYGAEYHPIGIRRFVDYALKSWMVQPRFLFIVGKGVDYPSYMRYQQTASQYSYSPVPTWGEPGSDNLFSSFNNSQKPLLVTGRLSAWNNQEIGDYLEKVKSFEAAIKPAAIPTIASELWKKKALHIAGGSTLSLQTHLVASLRECQRIFEDTLIGGEVVAIAKTSTNAVDPVSNATIDSMINQGLSYVSYYGHGSSAGFDYNLNSPESYHAKPRFPVFSSFACAVAQIFGLTQNKTISEKYIQAPNGGSIVMIAGNNSGWTGTLPTYMQNLYRSWSYRNYGKTLGEQYQQNIMFLQDNYTDDYMDIHTQTILFQGDPALPLYNPDKPDYAVEESGLTSSPVNITTANTSFELKAVISNLGKVIGDSVWVKVSQTRSGNATIVYADSVRISLRNSLDTLYFQIPIDAKLDIGMNNYTVRMDALEEYEELSEQNNQATLQVFIYSDNLVPVYPKEFAIVHQQGITLKASTLNAFAGSRRYLLEIDTTEQFNSPLKQSTEVISKGGVIRWTPILTYQNEVVYYWRATADSLVNGENNWTSSSFVYLANGSDGWNQSHYFQYLKDGYEAMQLLPSDRKFRFSPRTNTFKAEDKVIYSDLNDYHNVRQSINDAIFDNWGCAHTGAVQIVVIDSITGLPWLNAWEGTGGSAPKCVANPAPDFKRQMFEFYTNTLESRNNAIRFIDSIPNGNYIMIKNLIYNSVWDQSTINEWKEDEQVNGTGKSLYHTIRNLGFNEIDQFTSKKVFAFFMKKGYPATAVQEVSDSVSKIELYATFDSYPDSGRVNSTIVGPALEWKTFLWNYSAPDGKPGNDHPSVRIYGLDTLNKEKELYSGTAKDLALDFIAAEQYPNIRLEWHSLDSVDNTSPYLDYWRVMYAPVPEAALNAAAFFVHKDSLAEGETGHFSIAIENLTPFPMDSMLVRYKLIDANNVAHLLSENRYKKLAGNDTLVAHLEYDASRYRGKNFLFIEANPDRDQPEQYHPNNLGYLPFYLVADSLNPLLDVTFDGIHILDKDIVSAKPFIKILMRDENKFMPLNDTALMKVQLFYPNQSSAVEVPMDGTICRFIPAEASAGKKNEAYIEYKPTLSEDGVYKLRVQGRDKAGNVAGNAPLYEVSFTVENKPSITHVLNYPNPFSTATQFIFTMTGSEIPSQFKIQILSVTGKVVREIKKNELGPLHIGRNMTEYRWDGRDEYGQLLGNGVYLYRVVTSIRGQDVEHRANQSVDKFFKNGYGKLYIMR